MAVTITANFNSARQLLERLKSAKEKAVYVGFPAEFDEKVEGAESFNLASLAAVLEFGNGRGIKERPFLRQTLQENYQKYAALFAQYFQQGMDIKQIYENIASEAEGHVQLNIVKGNWVENADATKIAWKLKDIKDPKRRKKIRATLDPKSINKTTLVWSGDLRKSVKGIVR